MVQRFRSALRSGSPLVGIFGSIAVVVLLLIIAYEFRIPNSGTPAATEPAGAQPVPNTK